MTDRVVQKQKEALVATIKDCQKREELRLSRLASARSKSDYAQLAQRFDRERDMEKERIEHLRADLMLLNQKKAEGLAIPVDERREQQKEAYRLTQGGKYETAVSRFYGLETLSDVLFQTDVTRRFEKKDSHFKATFGKAPYNPRDDIRQLRLLEDKRAVLKQLIGLEQVQPQASGRSCLGTSRGNLSSLQYRGSDAASAYSGASSRSGSSYATFATDSAPRPVVRASSGGSRRPAPAVPRLALG